MDGGAWRAAVHGVAEGRTQLSDFAFPFHFHALEKEMATHHSVPAWRIPAQGSLVGCRPCGRAESATPDATQPQQRCTCALWGLRYPCVLLPLELSPEPGNLSNPRLQTRRVTPVETSPEPRPPRVPSAAGRPYWLSGARLPRDRPHSSRAGALGGRGGRAEGVCSPPRISRLRASSQLLPTYLSLNCSEGALMTALLHVSTTQSGGSQTSFKPEVPVISPINQR